MKLLIDELKKNKDAFKLPNKNEYTCREFISPFMTTAVKNAQSLDEELQLKAEEWLDGTRGFGPIDYSVNLGDVVVLVEEAKREDFDKGAA